MILSNNISNVYSRGKKISRVYSYGKLVWEKLSEDYNGVIFTAEEANSTIGLEKLSSYQTLEYRTVGSNWQNMTLDTVITLNNIGDKVYIRGELRDYNSYSNYTLFTMTGRISASGNCNYIWSKNDLTAPLKKLCGYCMFYKCGNSLTQAPELPATELAYACYEKIFTSCKLLTQAPALPATTLAEKCYNSMFYNCSNLTQAPALPATTLAKYCYQSMFGYCSSLTTAPELPAQDLIYMCYSSMFFKCSNLNYIKCLAINNINQISTWTRDVSSSGTFVCPNGVSWTRGEDGIPKNWTVEYI